MAEGGLMVEVDRIVIYTKDYGVYLGSFLGLGIWSKLDDCELPEAVSFDSRDQAVDAIQNWDSAPEGIELIAVKGDYVYVDKQNLVEYW